MAKKAPDQLLKQDKALKAELKALLKKLDMHKEWDISGIRLRALALDDDGCYWVREVKWVNGVRKVVSRRVCP